MIFPWARMHFLYIILQHVMHNNYFNLRKAKITIAKLWIYNKIRTRCFIILHKIKRDNRCQTKLSLYCSWNWSCRCESKYFIFHTRILSWPSSMLLSVFLCITSRISADYYLSFCEWLIFFFWKFLIKKSPLCYEITQI